MISSKVMSEKLIPRPYQVEGIKFLQEKKRAMLTDQPGMGKTLQAMLAAQPPVLVACPTYLVEQWRDVLVAQFPDQRIEAAYGSTYQRIKTLMNPANWLIINIEMMRSYDFNGFKTLIIDEAHHVRGRNAQQAKGALKLAQKAENVFLLTATPIYKTADDFWMLLHILYPKVFTSYHSFINMYMKTYEGGWSTKIVGLRNEFMFRRLLSKYMLGRTYQDVGMQLPDLINSEVVITPDKGFKNLYNQLKDTWRVKDLRLTNPMEVLLALRELTAAYKPKLDALISTIEDNPTDKLVIYTWYIHTAKTIAALLDIPYITGEMTASERVKVAKANSRIVATMSSLSEGIDLSDARMVIFYEEDYTPGRLYQALSRVRRASFNVDPIRSYNIVVKETIDATIHKCIKSRISDVKAIVRMELLD